MKKSIQAIAIALGITLAGIAGKTGDYYLRPTISLLGAKATQYEFDQLLPEMNKKMRQHLTNKTNPEYNELSLWLALAKEEIKKNNGLQFLNVNEKTLIEDLLTWMEGRK